MGLFTLQNESFLNVKNKTSFAFKCMAKYLLECGQKTTLSTHCKYIQWKMGHTFKCKSYKYLP